MALNPYITGYGIDTASSSTSSIVGSTFTSTGSVFSCDLYRHDIEKAKADMLARTVDKVRSKAFKVPRGTSILDMLQTDFDAWAGDIRAAIFN